MPHVGILLRTVSTGKASNLVAALLSSGNTVLEVSNIQESITRIIQENNRAYTF